MNTRRLRAAMAIAAAVSVAAAVLGIGVRATEAGHAAVDEPQYLLTALSLWEDGDLDISDELTTRRYREFFDAELPVQTQVGSGGRQLSPHDPLLPVLLAMPMGLAGWVAAKSALALVAGALAALLVWVAVRRLGVPIIGAATGAVLAGASPPLAVYGQQVYPELPAAFAVLVGVALGTGRLPRAALVGFAAAISALPWLGVKYVPVAAALTGVVLVRLMADGRRGAAAMLAGGLVGSGVVYLLVHRLIWGGWTAYATGDHFAGTGELSVVGVEPDYVGRSLRLAGLLVDRAYGLVAWQPAWLLAVPAAAALLAWRTDRPKAAVVAAPLLTGWAVATWLALTMHGFWWPGRQIVVVLPLAVLAVLWWVGRVVPRLRASALGLAAVGVVHHGFALVDGWAGRVSWVVDFQAVRDPIYQALRVVLPDYRTAWSQFWPLHLIWLSGLIVSVAVGVWTVRRGPVIQANQPTERVLVT